MIKKLFLIPLLLVLLSFFVFAECDENDLRCIYKTAAQSKEADICDTLEGANLENCKALVAAQDIPLESESPGETEAVVDTNYDSKSISNLAIIIGMLIVIIVFLSVVLFLFVKYKSHNRFVKNHAELMSFVVESLKKGVSEENIVNSLKKVGWKEKLIKESIFDAKNILKKEKVNVKNE